MPEHTHKWENPTGPGDWLEVVNHDGSDVRWYRYCLCGAQEERTTMPFTWSRRWVWYQLARGLRVLAGTVEVA